MRHLISLFLILSTAIVTSAQSAPLIESDTNSAYPRPAYLPRLSFGFSPFSLTVNRLRLEAETGINGNLPMLFSIAPIFYTGTTTLYANSRQQPINSTQSNKSNFDKVSGIGAELGLKMFMATDELQYRFLYWGAGIGIHSIRLDFEDYNWEVSQENGLNYYNYFQAPQVEKIKRTDLFCMIGGRIYASNLIYFDGSIGVQYQHTSISSTQYVVRNHYNGPLDFGYKGGNLRMNFTLGFSLF